MPFKVDAPILMIGFGSIGQAILPLLFKHFDISPRQVQIVSENTSAQDIAAHYKIQMLIASIDPHNYIEIISPLLKKGSVLLNLSVDISSVALIELCQQKQALYLDTSIEPWAGGYVDPNLCVSYRSNYALRESALALKQKYPFGATALLTHGANPGLVTHFVKQALLNIARDCGYSVKRPNTQSDWAQLAQDLNIKAIHIAEKDTQEIATQREVGTFVNTWSVDGFISEGSQPAELGWGSHEKHFPPDGERHRDGCQAAIYLNRPGMKTWVRSWAPNAGAYMGYLITHNEAISLSDYFTVKSDGLVQYRPTVHYSYHPCAAALLSVHEFIGNDMQPPKSQKIIKNEIVQGVDELGVLLMGHQKGAYWYGSHLSIESARASAPYNNATSLQVAVGVLAGLHWILNHPQEGIIEPEQMNHEEVLEIAEQYLGEFVGVYTDWTPLKFRNKLFPESIDWSDPWQFINIRIT